jgi:glycosyltransferase 2 family protein
MVSSDRVHAVHAGPIPPRRGPGHVALVAARWILIVVVIVAAAFALVANWQRVSATIGEMTWTRLLLAFACTVAGVSAAAMSWQVLVDGLGRRIGVGRSLQVYFVGMLGKYVPGTVWAYALQLELGRAVGLRRTRVFIASLYSVVVVVVGGLLVGALAVASLLSVDPDLAPLGWLYVLLIPAIVLLVPPVTNWLIDLALRILKRPRPPHRIRFPAIAASMAWILVSYLAYGLQLWVLMRGDADVGMPALLLSIGAMGFAMIAGVVAFFLPSGLGAREFVIVAALGPILGQAPALAVAVVSRVLFIVVDLVLAGGAVVFAKFAHRRHGRFVDDHHADGQTAPRASEIRSVR